MRFGRVGLCVLGLLVFGGCGGGDKPKVRADDAGAPDAGPKPIDGKIAAALSATGSVAPTGPKPPPNGVFAPGEADAAIAPNAPPKIELLDEGKEPRTAFKPNAAANIPAEFTVEFASQRAGQVSPQIAFKLAVGEKPAGDQTPDPKGKASGSASGAAPPKPERPRAPASASTPPASARPSASPAPLASVKPTASAPPAASAHPSASAGASTSASPSSSAALLAPPEGGSLLVLHITDVSLAKMQQVALPADYEQQLKLLVNTELRLRLGPNGVLAGIDLVLPHGLPESVSDAAEQLADILSLFELPAPDKPVGAGGYWMVADRRNSGGLPLLRYRLFRVDEIKDGVAKINCTVKQYMANGNLNIQGPQGADVKLGRFESDGVLQLVTRPGASIPTLGKAHEPLVLTLTINGQPAPPQAIETIAQLSVGGTPPSNGDDDGLP